MNILRSDGSARFNGSVTRRLAEDVRLIAAGQLMVDAEQAMSRAQERINDAVAMAA